MLVSRAQYHFSEALVGFQIPMRGTCFRKRPFAVYNRRQAPRFEQGAQMQLKRTVQFNTFGGALPRVLARDPGHVGPQPVGIAGNTHYQRAGMHAHTNLNRFVSRSFSSPGL